MASPASNRSPAPSGPAATSQARGFASALAAYLAWGLFPVYFKSVKEVPPLEILSHRIVWSMAFLVLLITWQRRWGELSRAARGPGLPAYLASTSLITANWLLFIWAVANGHVLEGSLGYFMNPLVNVLLGVAFLRERLSRLQKLAVALAASGVVALTVGLGRAPWISLGLALSFGLYGYVRKAAHIEPVLGLLVETGLLTPLAALYLGLLAVQGTGAFGSSAHLTALLAAAGVITAVPLILFAVGMRALRLSTMGLIQYVTPSSQFLLAVALYHERFTTAHAVAFAFIWTSLGLYTWEALRPARPLHAAPAPVADPQP